MLIISIGNHAMLLVQLGINSTSDVWKFCQNWTRLFVMLIISIGNHAMLLVQLGINSTSDVWKFCQNWTRLFVMLIIIGNHAMASTIRD